MRDADSSASDVSDIMWDRIESLSNNIVIGRWKFQNHEKGDLMEWILRAWEKLLGYQLVVSKLDRGWFCIHLLKDSDVAEVLTMTWVSGRCFLALHRWDVSFHPS